jgi:protein AbiQ
LAHIKKVTSECFATLSANVTTGTRKLVSVSFLGKFLAMNNLKFYEVFAAYIDYLAPYAPYLFRNKKKGQQNERKYIGVVIQINDLNYFAPLSSFKDKHKKMKDTIDFIKIKNYAVINLNNMFPVPDGKYTYVDISKERDYKYKSLLLAEYRFIKSIQSQIRKNANNLYKLKISGEISALTNRCNDFLKLEKLCKKYSQ